MGYDSGPPGASANELVRMAEGGLGAADAIRAATPAPRPRSAWRDDRGTIEAGRAADLVVVDGDPLADPAILLDPARIEFVFKDGRIVAGKGAGAAGAPA